MCSVPWPLNRSEVGGDLVLLQTFLFFHRFLGLKRSQFDEDLADKADTVES